LGDAIPAPGHEGLSHGSELPRGAQEGAIEEPSQAEGHTQGQPLGHALEATIAREVHTSALGLRRDELFLEPELPTQPHSLRARAEDGVRSHVEGEAIDALGADVAPEPARRLEELDGDGLLPAAQVKRRCEARNPAPDDGDRTTPARGSAKQGSRLRRRGSLRDAVGASPSRRDSPARGHRRDASWTRSTTLFTASGGVSGTMP